MDLTWLDPEHLDRRDVDGAVAVLAAARAVDTPHQPATTATAFAASVRYGWDGDPARTAVTRDGSGRVVGVLEVSLHRWDNQHVGSVELTVDPGARRRGLGTALFTTAVDVVRADGRRLVVTDCWDQPGPVAFAKAMGLDRVSEEVARRQDLIALDRARLARLAAEAAGSARGYELLRLPHAVPEDLLDAVVAMTAAINDAPLDDLDLEDEVFGPERIRAFERSQEAHQRRMYRLAARERATGVLAGHTVVAVVEDRPWLGFQFDTSVLREHRGHRLGLLLKAEMLGWLAEAEPQLRTLDTWNAASNDHMIAVNETLGYEVLDRGVAWQRHL